MAAIDPTTIGYEAEPAEVAALLAHLDDDAWGGDPVPAYVEATRAQVLYQAAADAAGVRRATLLARMHATGSVSYAQIATSTGLTRARVQQLVERGRVTADAASTR